MEGIYTLNPNQLGRDIHSKVYLLKDNTLNKELIIKIYEQERYEYYKTEKKFLDILKHSENEFDYKKNFFIMYKEINIDINNIELPKEINGNNNLEFLFYDYLSKLSLFDYIIDAKEYIKERHAKFICYELLMIIKNIQKIKICLNNINISNIMFDDNFDIKLIHFSEADIITEKNVKNVKNEKNEKNEKKEKKEKNKSNINNDLFELGQTLAKIITLGKFMSINYNEKENVYKIKSNNQKKSENELIFWKNIKIIDNNNIISEQFIKFFNELISSKKSNEFKDINELLKNEWLNDINKDLINNQINFKNDFKKMYEIIIDNREKENKINVDVNDLLNLEKKEKDSSIFDYFKNYFSIEDFEDYSNFQSQILGEICHDEKICNVKRDKIMENEIIFENKKEKMKKKGKKILFKTEIINLNKMAKINLDNKIKPKKGDFNYLEINIINNNQNKDVKGELKNLLKDFIQEIKSNVTKENDIYIENEKETSFDICYKIYSDFYCFDYEYNKILFLDEKYEKKIKNDREFKIKVKLIEGNNSNQYYLIFEGVSVDKEEFYEKVKSLKETIKSLFKNKLNN